MSSSANTINAIAINGDKARVVSNRPIPKLRNTYILVKPSAIALNPTDWKHIASSRAAPNGLSGCDYAGTVVQVGPDVTKAFKEGDRICGCAHGANYSQIEDGVFAEYAVVKGDVQMHTPDNLTDEQAATVSLGAITCGQGLYQSMGLNLPTDPVKEKTFVLIYGGSSATGSLGIQFAKLSGYTVITTCSPHNFAFVKSRGADAVFDYSAPDVGATIRDYTSNTLRYAWDTIGTEPSAAICAAALSSAPAGRYGTILVADPPRDDLTVTKTFMYSMFGEEFQKSGKTFAASKEDYEFGKMFMGLTEELLAQGKLKTHPEKIGKGGLHGALEGMEEMKAGKVSGEKLVYRVAETT